MNVTACHKLSAISAARQRAGTGASTAGDALALAAPYLPSATDLSVRSQIHHAFLEAWGIRPHQHAQVLARLEPRDN